MMVGMKPRREGTSLLLAAWILLWLSTASAAWLPARSQAGGPPWKERLDQGLRARLEKLTARKIKTRGKPKVARWENVDAQLADVVRILDVKSLLQESSSSLLNGDQQLTFEQRAEIDQVLASHTISYGRLFLIEDEQAYFPLTNSVLKLTDDEGLAGLDVYERSGFRLGQYAHKFLFEKTGGLAYGGGSYRLTFFQYQDNQGNLRASGNTNLLDTYVIRWIEVRNRAVIRLTADTLFR